MKQKSPIGIPEVFGSGKVDQHVFLVMEWIEKGPPHGSFWQDFGEKLADQHQQTQNQYGLEYDNHIGRLPQSNTTHVSWYEFFIEERLKPQISLAKQHRLIDSSLIGKFESLFNKLGYLVPPEPPALLHGDLWNGNFICGEDGSPYIFDPAVYYGHRETELAFTHLFGGFDRKFYHAYQQAFPLSPGFDNRIDIHNLYPLLVHVNLFGTSYLSGIKSTLRRFV